MNIIFNIFIILLAKVKTDACEKIMKTNNY